MTKEYKMLWLAKELTDAIADERSKPPCEYYDYFTSRKYCPYHYATMTGGKNCYRCLIDELDWDLGNETMEDFEDD